MRLRKLVLAALFTALIAILARVSIPVPFSPVPLTAQLAGIYLAGLLLGSRGGVLAVAAYLLLGAAGAPVFSLGRGGISILLGPSGGYLLGFLPGVFFCGQLLAGQRSPSLGRLAAALGSCMAATYLLGTVQLAAIMGFSAGEAIAVGVIPYLPLELVKMTACAVLGGRVRSSLIRHGLSYDYPRDNSTRPA